MQVSRFDGCFVAHVIVLARWLTRALLRFYDTAGVSTVSVADTVLTPGTGYLGTCTHRPRPELGDAAHRENARRS
jgi:hypothetical protein